MPKVLVTDASKNAALAVIRSLGSKNIDVTAGESTSFNCGFLSKYCKRRILYPPPELERTKFVKSMMELVKDNSFDLLIPITDRTMVPIIERKEDFEQYTKVATPNYPTAIKALDKTETIKIAIKHNIPCPKTTLGENINDIRKFSKETMYPLVMKPKMSKVWIGEKAVILKVTQNNYAYNPEGLIKKWRRLVSLLKKVGLKENFLMIQEFVRGEGYGVEALMWDMKPKAIFMHRRLREYPVTGGASTLRESVKDDKLAELGINLLRAMNWEGVAMVEFRVNKSTGEPWLMEVNGRFWGSVSLAINSGVDFPYMLYKLIVEGEDFDSPQYRIGLKQRWLLPGDVLWLYSSLIDGNGIVKPVKEFLKSFAVRDDLITLDDIAPLCGELVNNLSLLADVAAGRRTLFGEVGF